ncbi:hypothetical protein QZH41_012677 [Actinostola sp. cb2023]|nr:hypothetical protein QZH41_012677 [Actinostola sp. cb2023]
MWRRLYLDDFGEFCESLGLPVCPYSELKPDDPLPAPTPLLYGISPTVLEKPEYWPNSVTVCGYWYTELAYPSPDDITVLCPSHQSSKRILFKDFMSTLTKHQQRPLYIGFGSMEELGFFSSLDSVDLIGIINEGLLECDVKALLHVEPDSILLKAWEIMHKNVVNCNIYCITQQLSHTQLFPQCLAVMHHGGSGTVASAIRASVPQIVCPFMFDQSYWGDKVAWMGVGESVGHLRSLTVTSFTSALKTVSQNDCLETVSKYCELVDGENGIAKGVTILRNTFS